MADETVTPSRQQRVGAAARELTRRRLLSAAGEEFIACGYTGATVAAIAERAGVTVQTLYLAWGSKRELLRGFMEESLGAGAPHPAAIAQQIAGLEPRQTVAAIARVFAGIAERSAAGWALYRDAAAVDPAIADDWADLQSLRRATFASLISTLPLRAGLERDAASDTAWVIASPETYDLLVRRAGYSIHECERWVDETLAAALLGQ